MTYELPFDLLDPLYVYQGDPKTFTMEFMDDVDVPTDLTGVTLTAQWRPNRKSEVYVNLAVEETDLAGGLIGLVIDADASNAIVETATTDTARGVWDVQGDNGVTPVTYVTGSLVVRRDVTRG